MNILKCINQFIIIGVFYFISCFNLCSAQTGPAHKKLVVCYFRSWTVYQPGNRSFAIEDIDPSLCTHVVYGFVGLNVTHNSIRSRDPWQDLAENYGKNGFNRVTFLRKKFPHLKVSAAIGGWSEGSSNYSSLVAWAERRSQFVINAVDFLKKYNFDGLDVHWLYPGLRGGSPDDKKNFVMLIKELKEELNKSNLSLTASLAATKYEINTAYDVAGLSKYLDYVYLLAFEYNGFWNLVTGVNAPLYSKYGENVKSSIEYMLTLGLEPSKLILGLPLFGRTFYTKEPIIIPSQVNSLLGYVSKRGGPNEDGFMGYNEICLQLKNATAGWKKYWDNSTMTPYAVFDKMLISYDDEISLKEKINFALKKNIGGFMVSYLDTDDFHGDCSNDNNKYPLLQTINKGIEKIMNSTKKDEDEENVLTTEYTIINKDEQITTHYQVPTVQNSASMIEQNILIFVYVFIILYYL